MQVIFTLDGTVFFQDAVSIEIDRSTDPEMAERLDEIYPGWEALATIRTAQSAAAVPLSDAEGALHRTGHCADGWDGAIDLRPFCWKGA